MRFQTDVVEVIYSPVPPDVELVKQMVARGTRSFADYHGYLYYVGAEDEQPFIQQRLLSNEGPDFKDGPLNLRVLAKLPKFLKKVKNFKRITDKFNGEWMIEYKKIKET